MSGRKWCLNMRNKYLRVAFALTGLYASSIPLRAQTSAAKPAPRIEGHPDLSGYWKGTRDTRPGGNIGKDLPEFKLPLTPAGEAALKHNLTATVDPEALCIPGGIPRH